MASKIDPKAQSVFIGNGLKLHAFRLGRYDGDKFYTLCTAMMFDKWSVDRGYAQLIEQPPTCKACLNALNGMEHRHD